MILPVLYKTYIESKGSIVCVMGWWYNWYWFILLFAWVFNSGVIYKFSQEKYKQWHDNMQTMLQYSASILWKKVLPNMKYK